MRSKILLGLLFSSVLSFGDSNTVDAGWWGLLPAVIAIVVSVITKEVVFSLLLSVLVGSIIVNFTGGFPDSYFFGAEKAIDTYILNAAADKGHMSVIIFSLLISGMVSVLKYNNGMSGVIAWVSRYAKTKRSSLFATYFLGIIVFFDDYANTLIVGNTMRNITDRYNVSREKLAYVVDATAAPIACVALVSTWIGAEVEYIDNGISQAGMHDVVGTGYATFLNAIQYSFYPIITLAFVFCIILFRRDFGPMLTAENQTITDHKVDNVPLKTEPIYKGVVPILALVFISLVGIYLTGSGIGIVEHIQSGNSFVGLLWGSSAALFLAVAVNIRKGIKHNLESMMKGFQELLPAILILVLAWALNGVLEDLSLGDFLGEILTNSGVGYVWVPIITFVLASAIAFGTGSSFSTMSILYPIVIVVSSNFVVASSSPELYNIFYCAIASVLSGAVLGDHCSPISDTTILSSMATGCEHISHVKTQLPYAITVGGLSALMIVLSTVFSLTPIILLPLSILLICLIIRIIGMKN